MDMIAVAVILILNAIILISGLFMLKYPPKKKNVVFGFRTKRSFLSQDTWIYAQRRSGLYMIVIGIIGLLMIGIALLLQNKILSALNHDSIIIAITLLPLILIFVSVLVIQHELKRNFDDSGKVKK